MMGRSIANPGQLCLPRSFFFLLTFASISAALWAPPWRWRWCTLNYTGLFILVHIGLHWIDAEDLRAISVMTSHISAWQYASTVQSQIRINALHILCKLCLCTMQASEGKPRTELGGCATGTWHSSIYNLYIIWYLELQYNLFKTHTDTDT